MTVTVRFINDAGERRVPNVKEGCLLAAADPCAHCTLDQPGTLALNDTTVIDVGALTVERS
jgi:hypothetical protein